MNALILQQLLPLYFAAIYSWQLSSSEKSLVEKKFIHMCHWILQIYFTHINTFSFSLRNACLPCRLRKTILARNIYLFLVSVAKRCCTLSSQPFCWLADTQTQCFWTYQWKFWKFKFHLEHFPRSRWFLSFDGLSHYLYLFKKEPANVPLKKTTDRHFCDQGNDHHPTSKLLKCDLVQTLNTHLLFHIESLLRERFQHRPVRLPA